MTLTPRSRRWVMMVENKTSDQYLTTGKVSTRSIKKLRRYRLLQTLTKNFNLKTYADTDADADTDAMRGFIKFSQRWTTFRPGVVQQILPLQNLENRGGDWTPYPPPSGSAHGRRRGGDCNSSSVLRTGELIYSKSIKCLEIMRF